MQLNEILEEHTLESISERTRIPVENLESLVHGEWDRLKKVQALGFISILEREYGADLSDLRQECRNYFDSQRPPERRISVASEEVVHREGHPLSKFLILLILLGLAYGSWYFFVAQNRELESNATAPKKEGFYETVLQMANGWFGSSAPKKEVVEFAQSNASNVSSETGKESPLVAPPVPKKAEKSIKSEERGAIDEKKSSPKTTPLAEEVPKTAAEVPADTGNETQQPKEEEDEQIIARVKSEQAAAEQKPQSEKGQTGTDNTLQTGENLPKASGNSEGLPRMIARATEEPAAQTEVTEAGKKKPPVKSVQAAMSEPEAKNTENSPTKAVDSGRIVLHPRSKVWIGYTELRSMKRVATVTSKEIPFDTAKGDYIVAVGHGKLEFNDAQGKTLLKLADGKKHFFMVARGGVREISHEAFQRLNKSKVW
ncbi:hypothetical protein [Nitratifractor sp.]